MTNVIEADVLIIGGGPAGCACALYAARSALKTIVLDKNPAVGALAITHKIANYPGISADTTGSDLLEVMRDQAVAYGAQYQQVQVYGIDVSGPLKLVYTPVGLFQCKALVLATGAMGRSSVLPGEDEFLGRGVSYCATCDGAFYRNQNVVVYGANQEAIDEAMVLSKFASTVYWVTNAKPSSSALGVQYLESAPNVNRLTRTRLLSVTGNASGVTGVMLQKLGESCPTSLDTNGVFIYSTGSLPITDFMQGQIPLRSDGGVDVNADMMTAVEGVWAVGDIRNTPFKQAVVACSDGCIAAMSIDKFLNQRREIRVDWVHR